MTTTLSAPPSRSEASAIRNEKPAGGQRDSHLHKGD